MRISLLSLLLVLSYGILHAQSNFRLGYIITNENDTIVGLIDYRTDQMNAQACTFKKTKTSPVETYSPGQITGFRFTEDGKYYVSGEIVSNSAIVFLEYILQGIMNLYFYADKITGLDYYIFENQDGMRHYITKRPDEVSEFDGKLMLKQDMQYKAVVPIIFEEVPELREKAGKVNFSHESMISITKDYHNLVCTTGEPCIQFETKPDKQSLKIKFSIYGGVSFSSFFGNCLIIGGQMNFSMPRALLKSLSMVLDISLMGYPFSEGNFTKPCLYDLMIGARYTYHKGVVRPFLGGGIELLFWDYKTEIYYTDGMSIGFYGSAGVNFKTGRDSFIFLSAGYNYSTGGLPLRCYKWGCVMPNLTILPIPRITLGYTF